MSYFVFFNPFAVFPSHMARVRAFKLAFTAMRDYMVVTDEGDIMPASMTARDRAMLDEEDAMFASIAVQDEAREAEDAAYRWRIAQIVEEEYRRTLAEQDEVDNAAAAFFLHWAVGG
jgi:hypothetical protein